MSYASIIQRLPQELRPTMFELIETVEQNMRAQYAVRREDFDSLRASVQDLVEGQRQTNQQVAELTEAQKQTSQQVAELTEAQKQTNQQVAELTEAQKQTSQQVAELTEAQKQTNQQVAELTEAQKQTNQQVAELTEAQKQTNQQVAELTVAQKRTEETVHQLVVSQTRFETELGKFGGRQLESLYRERAPAYFGRILRRIRVINYQDLEETLEQHLSEDEQDDVRLLDLIVRGRPKTDANAPEVWLAVEVSKTVDRYDVERAQRRAAALRQAGYLAVPTVAGEDTTRGGDELARLINVVMLQNGSIENWEAALAQVTK